MNENYQLKKIPSNKTRKRIGRGPSSGHGKTSCRGQKGQLSRSGSKKRRWFEGGQMPLQRRLPKRGFSNSLFKKSYQIVNLDQIANLTIEEITPTVLKENGIIKKETSLIKILGNGELTRSFKITADSFSNKAKEKIEQAKGEVLLRKIIKKVVPND